MPVKVAFVDGPSIWNMAQNLEIKRISYPDLYDVILNKIGQARSFRSRPVITFTPASNAQIQKSAQSSGFDTIISSTVNGRDDRRLIERIENISPNEISEIVMASADQDFIPALRRFAKMGVRVFTLASRGSTTGQSPVGVGYENHFAGLPFTFVELADFADEISLDKTSGVWPVRFRAIVESDAQSPAEQARLLNALHSIELEFGVRVHRVF